MRMNIEAERSRCGMTKAKLCEFLAVSLTTYNAYIKGSAIPSSKLVMMADMFGVSCDYLLGRTTGESRKPSENT